MIHSTRGALVVFGFPYVLLIPPPELDTCYVQPKNATQIGYSKPEVCTCCKSFYVCRKRLSWQRDGAMKSKKRSDGTMVGYSSHKTIECYFTNHPFSLSNFKT